MLAVLLSFNKKQMTCSECMKKMSTQTKFAKDLITETSVTEVPEMCQDYTGKQKEVCIRSASIFTDAFKDGLSEPEAFCTAIGACKHNRLPFDRKLRSRKARPIPLHSRVSVCTECATFLDFLTGAGLSSAATPMTEGIVQKVCPKLPVVASMCDHINQHDLQKAVMLITSKFQSEDLCRAAQMCEGGAAVPEY